MSPVFFQLDCIRDEAPVAGELPCAPPHGANDYCSSLGRGIFTLVEDALTVAVKRVSDDAEHLPTEAPEQNLHRKAKEQMEAAANRSKAHERHGRPTEGTRQWRRTTALPGQPDRVLRQSASICPYGRWHRRRASSDAARIKSAATHRDHVHAQVQWACDGASCSMTIPAQRRENYCARDSSRVWFVIAWSRTQSIKAADMSDGVDAALVSR